MEIPKNLGKIEFLRDHPQILEKLIERSRDKSLLPFIKDRNCDDETGGFSWSLTEEGDNFWSKILYRKEPDHFYTLYPKEYPSIDLSKGWIIATEGLIDPQLIEIFNHVKKENYRHLAYNKRKYIINHLGLLSDDHKYYNLWEEIPDKASHLPIITFKQFETLILNKTQTNEKTRTSETIRNTERGTSIAIPVGRRSTSVGSRLEGNTTFFNCKTARVTGAEICGKVATY